MPSYTNSSHLPVGFTDDVFEALDIQDRLQPLYTSGTVFHTFLGEKLPDWKAAAALVRRIAENYELPYYTLSPTYSVCADHGYLTGEQYKCPICGRKTEVYSRITGYYRPVQNWNDGKSQEFQDRKTYAACASTADFRAVKTEEVPLPQEPEQQAGETLLFVTKTCPNCRIVKPLLDQAGVQYQIMDVAEHQELAKSYKLKQAPTLVVNGVTYTGVAGIKSYLKQ